MRKTKVALTLHIKIITKTQAARNTQMPNQYTQQIINASVLWRRFDIINRKWTPQNVCSRLLPRVKGIHVPPLRTAENVWKRIDVFNGAFESLYLGQRLSFLAVIRRQVISELVQSFCQAPHPHLLPLAGLHAPFRGHLWLVFSLRRESGSLWRAAERQIADLTVSGRAAQLRRRAHGIHLGHGWGGMMRVVIRSHGAPLGQNVDNRRTQVHFSYQNPRTEGGCIKAGGQTSPELTSSTGLYTDPRRFMGSQVGRKKFKEKPKCQNGSFRGTSFVITGVRRRLNGRIMRWKEK